MLLVLGTLIYNEILVLPFCKFDYYTRDNIEKRKKEKDEKKKENLEKLFENSRDTENQSQGN